MIRRAFAALAAPLVVVLMLAGCAQDAPGGAPTNPGASNPGANDDSGAVELVGMWRVGDAEGESADTWLRLDTYDFLLWRECGPIMGSWNASESLFLASAHGATGDCVTGNVLPEIRWLDAVASYRATVDGWELLDSAGSVRATLTIDGQPAPHPDVVDYLAAPPDVTDETRAHFRSAAPLPSSVTAAVASDLPGRWNPVGEGAGTDAHVDFAADGTWTGSDGCNGGMGRWAASEHGELLTTSGPSTLIACDGAAVPHWVASAMRAGFDGAELVLFDVDGAELGRLAR